MTTWRPGAERFAERKKTSFRAVFWVTVLANCVVFAWLHTEGRRAAGETALLEIGPNSVLESRKLDSWFRR
jgi:hypothetical protein